MFGGLTTSLSWSSFLGLTNDTGPNGDSSSTYYDSYARQTSTTSPFGATTNYTYSSAPYSSSNPATVTATTTSTEGSRWTKTIMDGLGRTVMVQTGNGSTTLSQAETVYNSCGCSPAGKMTQTALPHSTSASPAYTTYSYDGIGRTLSVLAADGHSTTTYSYQGNTVTVTDPAGKWKTFTMDAFGNLTQVAEPNPAGGSNYTTSYTYDVLNNLTGVSMPRPSGTQTRTFVYNGKLLTSATNPENGTVNYTYNSYNKVATKTDAKGQYTAYTYDTMARLTMVQRYPTGLSNGEDGCQRETYTYDNNNITANYSQYVAGRLATVQYFAGPIGVYASQPSGPSNCGTAITEQYSYNQAGAKTNKGMIVTRTLETTGQAQFVRSTDLESSYTYDNEGRMLSVQYPQSQAWSSYTGQTTTTPGPDLGYAYDTMGRLSTMTDLAASNTLISGTTYDPANRLLTIAGSYSETRSYNVMGQLVSLSNNSVNLTYAYSATQNNGKITGQTDNISGEQVVYAYDALNRLASAYATSGTWGQSYSYDGFGNLQNQTVTAGSAPSLSVVYNAANNQQTTDCADANGNIYTPQGAPYCSVYNATYTFDVSNRIVSATGGVQYSYAPGNKRIWKGITSGSGLTQDTITFWSVTGQKLGDYNLTGDPTIQYTTQVPPLTATLATANYYFGGKQIGKFNGSSVTYTGSDRLGSFGKYYPWGQEKPSATANNTEKFTGYFRDAETGLDYADQRYHQPGVGRFLVTDQANANSGEPATWNRYGYAGGDPVNNVDLHGMYYSPEACQQNPASCQGPPSGSIAAGCSSAGSGLFDYYDPSCQAQTCPASFAEEFFGNPGNGASADCGPGIPGAYVMAPTPPCPLDSIFGDFTTDPNSPTPIHTIFNPTVAGILDAVIAKLNIEGIVPIIEDGFRTESEQADRRKRYPTTAASGLSWHELGDAIDFKRDSNLAAINAVMIAAGFTAVAGDPGHYQMRIGTLTQSAVDACTQAHPNGN